MTFAEGDKFTFKNGTAGTVRWIAREGESVRAASWGEDLITVELVLFRGRSRFTELTEFRESELRERVRE